MTCAGPCATTPLFPPLYKKKKKKKLCVQLPLGTNMTDEWQLRRKTQADRPSSLQKLFYYYYVTYVLVLLLYDYY
jgi:hypothetical protein